MHARTTLMLCTAAAMGIAALATSLPSGAQGALKPVEALIVNPPSRPVPVTVLPPAKGATVQCTFTFNSGLRPQPYTIGGASPPISQLDCPSGVSVLELERVAIRPLGESSHFVAAFGLSNQSGDRMRELIAMISNGSPERILQRPVRLNLLGTDILHISVTCGTGIPNPSVIVNSGTGSACAGELFLMGTAAE